MRMRPLRLAITAVLALLLAMAWWGWQQGGLALLQLNMSLC